MSIESKIDDIAEELQLVRAANTLIDADGFSGDTVDDMKTKAKDVCDTIKDHVDDLKDLIDDWS